MKKKNECKKGDIAGLFIPGGLFIGMGVGFIINQLVGGLFIGLGIGFFCMAIAQLCRPKK